MVERVEKWPIERLKPYAANARTHSKEQIEQIAASITQFGFMAPILAHRDGTILAGHARRSAAMLLGLAEVPVIPSDHLTDAQCKAYILADNKLALNAGWDEELLAAELLELKDSGIDLALTGFSDEELAVLLGEEGARGRSDVEEDETAEAPEQAVTVSGDVWEIGPHRIMCGDSRGEDIFTLMDELKANVIFTSPPYADKREYDPTSPFRPVPPDKYTDWFEPVAANVQAILAHEGSYFLNLKDHAESGERTLYVKDLVLAHKREWGWNFVDELCWVKTAVPGGWANRFKNAWEPVFHFTRTEKIKFRPDSVSHVSDGAFDYGIDGSETKPGLARPSNVITCPAAYGDKSPHSAPFPRALVEFFVNAYSDPGDIIFDPFLGSGTVVAAAHVWGRVGYGMEISPAYTDVALLRIRNLTGIEWIVHAVTGKTFEEVARERGVDVNPDARPKQADAGRITHKGTAPKPASKRKSR